MLAGLQVAVNPACFVLVSLDSSLYTAAALEFVIAEVSGSPSASKARFVHSRDQVPADFEQLPAGPGYLLDYSRLYQQQLLAVRSSFPSPGRVGRAPGELPPVESVFRIDFETYLREAAQKSHEGSVFVTAKGIPIVSFRDLLAKNLLSLAKHPPLDALPQSETAPDAEPMDSLDRDWLGKRSPLAPLQPSKQRQPRRGRPPKPKLMKTAPKDSLGLPPAAEAVASPVASKQLVALDCYPGSLLDLNQPQCSDSSSRSSSEDGQEDPFGLFL